MKDIVIYTAIFGGYDNVVEPDIDLPYKMVMFTDGDIKSDKWEVIKVPALYKDSTRNARKYKLLPHRYLSEYNHSIWVDGNFKILKDPTPLVGNAICATYDHTQCFDKRDCIYQEAQAILDLGKQNGGYKDNPDTIIKQVNHYSSVEYPQRNGLLSSGILVREHNNPMCVLTMEDWWTELKHGSKRDQLSFNYVAWKNRFPFDFIPGDIRDNEYFKHQGKHTGK